MGAFEGLWFRGNSVTQLSVALVTNALQLEHVNSQIENRSQTQYQGYLTHQHEPNCTSFSQTHWRQTTTTVSSLFDAELKHQPTCTSFSVTLETN